MRRERVQIFFDEPSLTQQHFKDECDVNHILGKYSVDAIAQHAELYKGQYGDFSDIPDYQCALNRVLEADEAFMSLPANVRVKFDNDPGKFLEFVDNPANKDEMKSLGLLRDDVPVSVPVSDNVQVSENRA